MSDNTTLIDNLNSIKNSKADIKQALIDKGQQATDVLATYADLIEDIETGIDTSDATATASDIKEGKTAYVDGEKITGIYVDEDLTDVLDAQDQKIAELEQSLENKTAGYGGDEIKSIWNKTISNGEIKTFELEPNSVYLFVSVTEANGNVLTNHFNGYIFTNIDTITLLPFDENDGFSWQGLTFTNLTMQIQVYTNRWQAVSITKITPNIDKYLQDSDTIAANSSKQFTCDYGYHNYLLVVNDGKYTFSYIFTSANATSNTARMFTYPYSRSTDALYSFNYTVNNGRSFTITNKKNYEIRARLIHL